MGSGDAARANLRRFLTYTVAATGRLEGLAERFRGYGSDFTGSAGSADATGKNLNEALGDFREDSAEEIGRLEEALEDLAEAAVNGQAEVGSADEALTRAAADVHDEAELVSTRLSVAGARLAAEGFTPLDARVDGAVTELLAAEQALVQACDGLDASLAGEPAEAATALEGVVDELERNTADLARDEQGLEAAFADAVQAVDAAGDAFEPACTQLESDIEALYEALDTAVAEQGQEWLQRVSDLAQETSSFAAAAADERIGEPRHLVEDEAFAALEQEDASMGTVIDEGSGLAAELEPLVDELAACLQVVARVAELLDALAQ